MHAPAGHLGTYGPHFSEISLFSQTHTQLQVQLRGLIYIWTSTCLISISSSVPSLSSAYLTFLRMSQRAALRRNLFPQAKSFHVSTPKWMQCCTNTIALRQIPKCWRSARSNGLSVHMHGFALAPLSKKVQGLISKIHCPKVILIPFWT